ncbi:hypothetical protein NEHOM01_0869 [Nematocida homosporus]|uniref:uncharacterized protein n=1 Tax=Nematocida homosporus TaxID=1912981 RepID=UPI002220BA62|nr:uncharacterized protein NEHOM01_0869 [Nematocida homosporus]KAI5185510.1 hypothetical protein NEHOM01_0869 [Nematocida homosporus]
MPDHREQSNTLKRQSVHLAFVDSIAPVSSSAGQTTARGSMNLTDTASRRLSATDSIPLAPLRHSSSGFTRQVFVDGKSVSVPMRRQQSTQSIMLMPTQSRLSIGSVASLESSTPAAVNAVLIGSYDMKPNSAPKQPAQELLLSPKSGSKESVLLPGNLHSAWVLLTARYHELRSFFTRDTGFFPVLCFAFFFFLLAIRTITLSLTELIAYSQEDKERSGDPFLFALLMDGLGGFGMLALIFGFRHRYMVVRTIYVLIVPLFVLLWGGTFWYIYADIGGKISFVSVFSMLLSYFAIVIGYGTAFAKLKFFALPHMQFSFLLIFSSLLVAQRQIVVNNFATFSEIAQRAIQLAVISTQRGSLLQHRFSNKAGNMLTNNYQKEISVCQTQLFIEILFVEFILILWYWWSKNIIVRIKEAGKITEPTRVEEISGPSTKLAYFRCLATFIMCQIIALLLFNMLNMSIFQTHHKVLQPQPSLMTTRY